MLFIISEFIKSEGWDNSKASAADEVANVILRMCCYSAVNIDNHGKKLNIIIDRLFENTMFMDAKYLNCTNISECGTLETGEVLYEIGFSTNSTIT